MKMFKSSNFWINLVKEEPYISPSTFDHFAGRLLGLCKIVWC